MPTRPKGKCFVCHNNHLSARRVFYALGLGTWAAHTRVHISWSLAFLCDSSPDRLDRFVHIIVSSASA